MGKTATEDIAVADGDDPAISNVSLAKKRLAEPVSDQSPIQPVPTSEVNSLEEVATPRDSTDEAKDADQLNDADEYAYDETDYEEYSYDDSEYDDSEYEDYEYEDYEWQQPARSESLRSQTV
jgi:hypothetical protein